MSRMAMATMDDAVAKKCAALIVDLMIRTPHRCRTAGDGVAIIEPRGAAETQETSVILGNLF